MVKRVLIFLLFLSLLSLTAFAENPHVDGWIDLHSEYHETASILQSDKNESNNNVCYAMLCWTSSPKDYSVFLALSYSLYDYVKGGGKSGVEITVNNDLCAVIHADGTITDLNNDLFDVDFCFREFDENVEGELQCEARVGIKYGLDRLIEIGIRILDCSGIPSNYYRRVVYTPPRAATWTETTTTQTQKKTTTQTTTTQTTTRPTVPKSTTGRAAETSTTTLRTTRPVITAAQGTRSQTSNAETSEIGSRNVTTTAVRTSAKPTRHSVNTRAQTTAKVHSTVPAGTTAALLSASAAETETTDGTSTNIDTASAYETAVQTAVRYREASKLRFVGSVLAAVLLTSALFVGVFAGINARRKKEDPPVTPQEQHEDLG